MSPTARKAPSGLLYHVLNFWRGRQTLLHVGRWSGRRTYVQFVNEPQFRPAVRLVGNRTQSVGRFAG